MPFARAVRRRRWSRARLRGRPQRRSTARRHGLRCIPGSSPRTGHTPRPTGPTTDCSRQMGQSSAATAASSGCTRPPSSQAFVPAPLPACSRERGLAWRAARVPRAPPPQRGSRAPAVCCVATGRRLADRDSDSASASLTKVVTAARDFSSPHELRLTGDRPSESLGPGGPGRDAGRAPLPVRRARERARE